MEYLLEASSSKQAWELKHEAVRRGRILWISSVERSFGSRLAFARGRMLTHPRPMRSTESFPFSLPHVSTPRLVLGCSPPTEIHRLTAFPCNSQKSGKIEPRPCSKTYSPWYRLTGHPATEWSDRTPQNRFLSHCIIFQFLAKFGDPVRLTHRPVSGVDFRGQKWNSGHKNVSHPVSLLYRRVRSFGLPCIW